MHKNNIYEEKKKEKGFMQMILAFVLCTYPNCFKSNYYCLIKFL